MHNGPVTECATRRRYVGKFYLSCSECGLLSSYARPVAPPPVTSANVIKTSSDRKQVAVTACTTRGLCLSVLQLKANVNGECKCWTLHERPVASSTCPLPVPKRIALDVVRSRQWGLFVQLSQYKCHRMLSAPNSTEKLQWMWVAITSYTIQALSPLCQLFN